MSGGTLSIVKRVSRGDVWRCADQYLFCGDSRDSGKLDKAISACGFAAFDLCVTDPPYGVDYGTANKSIYKAISTARKSVTNDAPADQESLLVALFESTRLLSDVAPLFCFAADLQFPLLFSIAQKHKFRLLRSFVWCKPYWTLAPKFWGYSHEMCYMFVRDATPVSSIVFNGVSQGTLLIACDPCKLGMFCLPNRHSKMRHSCNFHPTEKPVKFAANFIAKHTTKEGRVLDLFAGSGSTLHAAYKMGRRAFGVELEAHWCDYALALLSHVSQEQPNLVCNVI